MRAAYHHHEDRRGTEACGQPAEIWAARRSSRSYWHDRFAGVAVRLAAPFARPIACGIHDFCSALSSGMVRCCWTTSYVA